MQPKVFTKILLIFSSVDITDNLAFLITLKCNLRFLPHSSDPTFSMNANFCFHEHDF